jgi:hypothetical protein
MMAARMSALAMRRISRIGVAVIVLAAWLGRPAVAGGAGRRGLIVRAVAGAPVTAAPATEAMARALGPPDVVEDPLAVARARQAAGAVERSRLADFGRARELAREGWRAYLKADPSFAEAQLVNARRTLEAVLDLDGALELLADVSLRLGAVRLKSGRAGDAQAAFALAATLDPGRELPAQEWSPAVVSAYQHARGTGGADAASAALEIVVGAEVSVEIDGAAIGQGALAVRVAPGEHVVVARAPGRRAAGLIVLASAAGARVELPLEADPLAQALAPGEPFAIGAGERVVARVVDAVGVFADLDELWLVVVTWRGGRPTLIGQRCALQPLACTPVREVRFASVARLDAGARQLASDLGAGDGAAAAGATRLGPIVLEDTRATEPEPPAAAGGPHGGGEARRPWWKNGWVWAGVGAVALAAGGTVWLLSDRGPGDVEWRLPPLLAF